MYVGNTVRYDTWVRVAEGVDVSGCESIRE